MSNSINYNTLLSVRTNNSESLIICQIAQNKGYKFWHPEYNENFKGITRLAIHRSLKAIFFSWDSEDIELSVPEMIDFLLTGNLPEPKEEVQIRSMIDDFVVDFKRKLVYRQPSIGCIEPVKSVSKEYTAENSITFKQAEIIYKNSGGFVSNRINVGINKVILRGEITHIDVGCVKDIPIDTVKLIYDEICD